MTNYRDLTIENYIKENYNNGKIINCLKSVRYKILPGICVIRRAI